MGLFAWTITILLAIMLALFVYYLLSLRRLSTAERPLTRTFDRYGDVLGVAENPDYRENAAEEPPENVLDQIAAPPERIQDVLDAD